MEAILKWFYLKDLEISFFFFEDSQNLFTILICNIFHKQYPNKSMKTNIQPTFFVVMKMTTVNVRYIIKLQCSSELKWHWLKTCLQTNNTEQMLICLVALKMLEIKCFRTLLGIKECQMLISYKSHWKWFCSYMMTKKNKLLTTVFVWIEPQNIRIPPKVLSYAHATVSTSTIECM